MSRRPLFDTVVVGAGVVGSATALTLAQQGLKVAIVEAREPAPWRADVPDLRVYAFAPDNAALLDDLGVWADIAAARAQPYRHMRVWDAAGGGELSFHADQLGRDCLGWIVENDLLVDRLWAALPGSGVRQHCPDHVVALDRDAQCATLTLDSGTRLRARLVVAADGAGSRLRELAGLDAHRHDYGQRALVAYVGTERGHEDTAWQRFLPSGPLAFLPCTSEPSENHGSAGQRSSIVWTLPEDEAQRLLQSDEATFRHELTRAFDATLGAVTAVSQRAAFPLRRQLAGDYVAGRVILCGDAAHVVHPLAGQGVNLGLRDVSALRESIADALAKGADFAAGHRLAKWQRHRRSDVTLAAYAFDGINRLFSNDALAPTLLRGHLLGLAGRMPPVTRLLWRHAAGL